METSTVKKLLDIRKNLDDRDCLIYTITRGIAPVLEGVKPGTVLNFSRNSRNALREWKSYEQNIEKDFNISYSSLFEDTDRSLVFYYNESLLKYNLDLYKNRCFLHECGYRKENDTDSYIEALRQRLRGRCPHEIGLFLGIPLEDVRAFIDNNGKNYIFCGYWKVYSQPYRAIKIFNSYDRAVERALTEKFIM